MKLTTFKTIFNNDNSESEPVTLYRDELGNWYNEEFEEVDNETAHKLHVGIGNLFKNILLPSQRQARDKLNRLVHERNFAALANEKVLYPCGTFEERGIEQIVVFLSYKKNGVSFHRQHCITKKYELDALIERLKEIRKDLN